MSIFVDIGLYLWIGIKFIDNEISVLLDRVMVSAPGPGVLDPKFSFLASEDL